MHLDFTVIGNAKTQGSKHGIVRGGRAIVVDDESSALADWREAVRHEAVLAMAGRPPITGPVDVQITITRTRPKSHYRSNGCLNARTATYFPVGRNSGDVDKLARAICDSLTEAGVWGDDCQVASLLVRKQWCDLLVAPRAVISVQDMNQPNQGD